MDSPTPSRSSSTTRASTVSLAYSEVPGMDLSSGAYELAQYMLAQASANARLSSKRVRGGDFIDVRTPTAGSESFSCGLGLV